MSAIDVLFGLALIQKQRKERALKEEQDKRDKNVKTEDAEFEIIEQKQLPENKTKNT